MFECHFLGHGTQASINTERNKMKQLLHFLCCVCVCRFHFAVVCVSRCKHALSHLLRALKSHVHRKLSFYVFASQTHICSFAKGRK